MVGAVLLAKAAPGDQADPGLLQQPHAVEHVGGLVVLLQEERRGKRLDDVFYIHPRWGPLRMWIVQYTRKTFKLYFH